jgi:DNA-binding transcriptional LysR family regulator
METRWLEDFVSLAETRSFSRSAQLRHVTQPAFSRRIQALEAWAGVDLVDRSSYPTRLTPAGETLLAQAIDVLGALQATRNLLHGHQASAQDMIAFAVPHALAFTFFPHWAMDLRQRFGAFKSRLVALNVHDAVYEMLSLGTETLAPYARAGADDAPLFRLPGNARQRVPYLSYASGAYLGRLVDLLIKQAGEPLFLDPIYETDMAEGLKAMALEGHGVAFLPASSVAKELRARRLVPAAPKRPSGTSAWEVTMEVRIYRERPEHARHVKPGVQALWEFLAG